MKIDVEFFKASEVIDYSMLVGVCDLPSAAEGERLLGIHDNKPDSLTIQEKTQ